MTNQLAKSLHTVSVLVNVTRHFMEAQGIPASDAMGDALLILRLEDKEDVYKLRETALRQIAKEA